VWNNAQIAASGNCIERKDRQTSQGGMRVTLAQHASLQVWASTHLFSVNTNGIGREGYSQKWSVTRRLIKDAEGILFGVS